MRILIDIRLLAKGGHTGIPGYTRELTDNLIRHYPEHEFTLFYNGFTRQPLPEAWRAARNTKIIESGIPNRLLDISFRLSPFRNFAKLRNDLDVIFSPHFNLLPKSNTPRVITFHDLSFIHYPQFFSPKQRLWHKWQNYAKQAQEASHLIAVSEYTKSDLVNCLKIPEEKISVIYSGISPEFHELRTQNLELRTRPYFLFLGTLEPRKNIPVLIKAFNIIKQDARFKDYELIIAGRAGYKASEIYKTALLRQGSAGQAATDIRFLENISDAERPALYRSARAFVFPSWFEGFGFPPLEAQACGTPVVASDRTSLPEILGASALYFNPWRIDELAEQMKLIETNPKVRDNIVSAGLTNVKKFSWDKAAEKLISVFEHVRI